MSWELLFLFPKAVLRWRPLPRGGKSHRSARATSLQRAIVDRLHRWSIGDYATLWEEAVTDSRSLQSRPISASTSHLDRAIRRAILLAEEGSYSRALASLLSHGIAPVNPDTEGMLRRIHPPASPPVLPADGDLEEEPLQVKKELVAEQARSFPSGSASGASGFRPQHLKDLLSAPNQTFAEQFQDGLTSVVNAMLAGDIPSEMADLVASAPLIALNKSDGGVRPIAIGETFRRLASKCCCAVVAADARSLLAPRQVGVGVPGGAEATVHAVRSCVEEMQNRGDKLMLKVDFKNAFNSVNRQAFLDEVRLHFPQIYNWVSFCYGQPARLFFGASEILSESGVQQGDPLGPLLFSLALQRLVLEIDEAVPDLDLHAWYLDDGTMIADSEKIAKVLDIISSGAPSLGLQLNAEKTELWWPSSRADPVLFPPSRAKWVGAEGVKLLGSPIGSDEFVQGHLRDKIEELAEMHRKLLTLDDSQVQLCILRCCLGFGKINHLLRTSPPAVVAPVIPEFDSLMQSTLCQTLSVDSLEPDAWSQATLPIRLGGLGLLCASDISIPAYVASFAESLKLSRELAPSLGPALPALDRSCSLLEAFNRMHDSEFSMDKLRSGKRGQHALLSAAWVARANSLLSTGDRRSKARLRGLRMPHAADFLKAAPIPGYDQRVKGSRVFQTMVKRYLGVPLLPAGEQPSFCRGCKKDVMDCFGDHALVCRQGSDKITRHNRLTGVLIGAAKKAGLRPVPEQLHLLPDNNRRPGDITLRLGDRDLLGNGNGPDGEDGDDDKWHTVAYDVTVSDTLQQSYLKHAAAETGYVLARAIDAKLSKHEDSCNAAGIKFIPLAWESMGGSSSTVHQLVDEWSAAAANRRGIYSEDGLASERFGLFCRLSVALQRSQAETVLKRISPASLLPTPPPPSHSIIPSQLDPRSTLASAASLPYPLYVPDEHGIVRV